MDASWSLLVFVILRKLFRRTLISLKYTYILTFVSLLYFKSLLQLLKLQLQ